MGFSVPEDVSIVAWDDSLICQVVHPPLTTVTRDIPAYGEAAAIRLLAEIEGRGKGDVEFNRGVLTPRASTAPPAATSASAPYGCARTLSRQRRPALRETPLTRLTLNRISDSVTTGLSRRRRLAVLGSASGADEGTMGYPNGSGHDRLATVGHQRPWVGANFWSRVGGPRMWDRYDGQIVRQELATLAAHGCNVSRSFCYWPDFVPEPERLDAAVLERFADFLDAHVELGLGTIPTFIVGHMSGENWDPAWRGGRDLYRDVWLVGQQAWFAGEIAARFKRHPAIVGWLVSNEMPIYGGPGTTDEISAWARAIVDAAVKLIEL